MIIQEYLPGDNGDYLDLTSEMKGVRLVLVDATISVSEVNGRKGKTIELRILEGTLAVRPVSGNMIQITVEPWGR